MRNEKGHFAKGNTPWHKGKHTGIIPKSAFKKGMTPWNKGKKGVMPIPWNKKPKVKKICPSCKKIFYSIPAKASRPFCSQKCAGIARRGIKMSESTRKKMSIARQGSKNWKWMGGQTTSWGYNVILQGKKYVNKSRIIMELYLGRKLSKSEVIHHINGIKNDDRICNLMLFPNNSAHRKFHNCVKLT